ncbi:GGDEF domain-containing protein [Paraburkholderia acidipaludis]|uniref:GGDEF domain-containing protein n=1 Tax=Paraburkholderia acidipaludis TaxID=660537 RepID=UPI00047F6A42|nr:GGDEF domain-containing protein [Paraburkholderia acidipaludis]
MFSPLALFGILIVSCLMSVAILGSLHRTAVPGIDRWCASYALFAVTSAFVLLAGERPHPLAIVCTSLIALVAVLLLVQGTRQFLGMRPALHKESAAFGIAFAALAYFTCVSPNVDARVILLSTVLAYGRIAVGILVLRHTPRDGARYAFRFVTAAAWLGALVHVARAVAIIFGLVPPSTFLQASPWNVLLVGLGIVSLPCMSIGMVMLVHDQIVKRMDKLATIDELTGALMRRAFMAKANRLLSEAVVTGKPLSITILDIDNFKGINDRFGHAIGDRTLTHIASVVFGQLRSDDLFGRLGGEEFAIVFVDARKDSAAELADALRLAVEQSPVDGVRCTLSAGVDRIAPDDTLERAMARADAALYTAKAMGRNRIVTASEVEVRDVA